MATPGEKLAASLEVLHELQRKGISAIKTSDISRLHRERLLINNFIREVVKGWYIPVPVDEQPGDSTSWYISYWSFCAIYLNDRYGESYCLSPEQSILILTGNWTIPQQMIIRSLKGPNGITNLPFNTSIFSIKSPLPESAEIIKIEGLRLLSLPSSLIHASSVMFTNNTNDMRTAMAMIKSSSEMLALLLNGGHSTIAGRLAGAFRNNGQEQISTDILRIMRKAGYDVRESDPMSNTSPTLFNFISSSPYIHRIKLMWQQMREIVINHFPEEPGLPVDHEKYMQLIEDIYVTDAYHSLSIEKYNVTPELIERVRSGKWDIHGYEEDRKQKDAMAARGYWQAAQKVKNSIRRILDSENPGFVVSEDHGEWYSELFAPSVMANLLTPSSLAGYRSAQVYISQSKHVPLNVNAVRDTMPVLFDLLQNEAFASVRAVLGHFIFVYIHPYMDGNGRMARFLMNVMLASGGYPWTVIPVEERITYMASLEKASTKLDIDDFTKYLAYLVDEGLKGTPVASIEKK